MRIGSSHLPLNALQGFEAAARLLNMRRAGEELGVTQSAVSHQVRQIEAALGLPLFEPNRRRLVLNAEGRRFLSAVQGGLDRISAGALHLGEHDYSGTVTVAVPPAFRAQWLVPRLPDFLRAFPDLSLSLQTLQDRAAPLPRVDVAVVFDRAQFPGMVVETLADLEMYPVCAPDLATGRDGLTGATLIHEDDGTVWARWFASAGAEQTAAHRDIRVDSTQDALSLARAGVGYAIDDRFMGARNLGTGQLVRPFGALSFAYGRYSMVTAGPDRLPAAAAAFAGWLKREVGRDGSA